MAVERTEIPATAEPPPGKKLRIAVCLSHFYPTVGGAEQQLLQLARRWAANGHNVRVITRPVPGLSRRDELDGVEIRRSIRTLSLGPLFGASFICSLVASLVRLGTRYDLVLAAQAPWEAVATGLIRRLTGRPTAVRLANTGSYGDLRQLERATGRGVLTWCVKSNSAFIALSKEASDELRQLGCREDSIWQLTNGVDTSYFVPPDSSDRERDRTVLFVGRLSEQKNPLTLLLSWQRVNAQQQYRLLIAGDGHLASSIRQLIGDWQLGNVELLGHRPDLRSVYHRASVFVLPSLSEGCSNALLEAMACGLCPVVSNIGGNTDVIVDGVNGRTVEARNVQQLSDTLSEMLTDREARERLAKAARNHVVAHHDADHVARQYLDLFVRMME